MIISVTREKSGTVFSPLSKIAERELVKSSKPTRRIRNDTIIDAMYSILAWPNGWSRSAGFSAILKLTSVTIEDAASEKLLRASAITATERVIMPRVIFTPARRRFTTIPTIEEKVPYRARTLGSLGLLYPFTNILDKKFVKKITSFTKKIFTLEEKDVIIHLLKTQKREGRYVRMKLLTYSLESTEYKHLVTEIMFNISSARSLGYDLLLLNYANEPSILTVSRSSRILKSLKKKSFIQYLVTSEQCNEKSEEAEYLYNKFPNITDCIPNGSDSFFIIKL